MNRVYRSSSWITCVVTLTAASWPMTTMAKAAPQSVTGRVTNVTLYRTQALVTRTIDVKGPQGSSEVVVTDLPESVSSDSLFAEGGESVEVRAVRYRSRAVGQEPREEVRKLDDAIAELNDQIELVKITQELLGKRAQYLDQLEGFVAPAAKLELSKGILNAEALKQVSEFSFQQREEVVNQQLDLAKQDRDLSRELSLLQRKKSELTDGSAHSVREAVLFLEKRAAGDQTVRLSYLVHNCGWSPSYTIRTATGQEQVRVEYNALIQQMSGEDWQAVNLSLSTASPALSAAGPGLAPFHVTLAQPESQQKVQKGEAPTQSLAKKLEDIRGRQQSAIMEQRNTLTLGANLDISWRANAAANDWQGLELTNPADLFRTLPTVDRVDDGPSLRYQLDAPVSLASRSDQQMVRIVQADLKSRFYHVATPVLSSYVYREAELVNDSQHGLLGGPMTVYLDERFVGHSEIPTVAQGQKFVVGLGADPQLRTKRELAARTENVQGGNQELQFTYRLVVENYKQEEVAVRVLDRLPFSNRRSDIRVTLDKLEDPLSEDKLYLRTERPKGILRWEIDVPAGATGENARIINYSYKVEFDREFQITTVRDRLQNQQEEFEQLQHLRLSH